MASVHRPKIRFTDNRTTTDRTTALWRYSTAASAAQPARRCTLPPASTAAYAIPAINAGSPADARGRTFFEDASRCHRYQRRQYERQYERQYVAAGDERETDKGIDDGPGSAGGRL